MYEYSINFVKALNRAVILLLNLETFCCCIRCPTDLQIFTDVIFVFSKLIIIAA